MSVPETRPRKPGIESFTTPSLRKFGAHFRGTGADKGRGKGRAIFPGRFASVAKLR